MVFILVLLIKMLILYAVGIDLVHWNIKSASDIFLCHTDPINCDIFI